MVFLVLKLFIITDKIQNCYCQSETSLSLPKASITQDQDKCKRAVSFFLKKKTSKNQIFRNNSSPQNRISSKISTNAKTFKIIFETAICQFNMDF